MSLYRSFIVEGNIGAGKSTFLRLLQERLPVHVVFEPHEQWQKVGGTENLLEKFYTDAPRWAYTFQTYAFVTRVLNQEEHAHAHPTSAHILERSVFSDRFCFAKNSFEMGLMTTLEWQLYQEWFTWLVNNYVKIPQGFIYLQTDPEICYQRLLKRARHEEATVSKDYIQKLHQKHEDWLIDKKGIEQSIADIPVLVLSCNNDFEYDKAEQERHINSIMQFIAMQQKPAQPTCMTMPL